MGWISSCPGMCIRHSNWLKNSITILLYKNQRVSYKYGSEKKPERKERKDKKDESGGKTIQRDSEQENNESDPVIQYSTCMYVYPEILIALVEG